jgi:hypothetical protein
MNPAHPSLKLGGQNDIFCFPLFCQNGTILGLVDESALMQTWHNTTNADLTNTTNSTTHNAQNRCPQGNRQEAMPPSYAQSMCSTQSH